MKRESVQVMLKQANLAGDLAVPDHAQGLILFAHGSGSSRLSPRNRYVAGVLQESGLATLLVDLLTAEEERIDFDTRKFRFDIGLLASRLIGLTDWLGLHVELNRLPLGYFGASTGSAAALIAAAKRSDQVRAVVSRGGRPDLAESSLPDVRAPTLLIVGEDDSPVLGLNRKAFAALGCTRKLEVVSGATHLFEEPGKLEAVSRLANDWFLQYLG